MAALLLAACDNPFAATDPHGHVVVEGLVAEEGQQTRELLVVPLTAGGALDGRVRPARTRPTSGRLASAPLPDGRAHLVIRSGQAAGDPFRVERLDLRTLEATPVGSLEREAGGMIRSEPALRHIALSGDGGRLVQAGWERDGAPGLGVFELTSDGVDPAGWIGSLVVPLSMSRSMTAIRMPNGEERVAVVAHRPREEMAQAEPSPHLYLIDPARMEVADSIVLPPGSRPETFVVAAPAGNRIYVSRENEVLRLDLATSSVGARAAMPWAGSADAVSPDGERIIWHGTGSDLEGRVKVLDPDLEVIGSVDFTDHHMSGRTPFPRWATFSRDGRSLFLTTGTNWVTQSGPIQRGFLLRIDMESLNVQESVDLGAFSLGEPLLYER